MPSEKSIEKKVVAWAEAHGVYTRKFSSPAHRGVPDRIFICRKKVVFVEFKRLSKEPTDLQQREMRLIQAQGVPSIWGDDYTLITSFLRAYFGCS